MIQKTQKKRVVSGTKEVQRRKERTNKTRDSKYDLQRVFVVR